MSKGMTAVEYFKAKSRMCDSFMVCWDCPLNEINSTSDVNCFNKGFEEEAIAIVQKWNEEHPIKTRQSEFLKIFPDTFIVGGAINIKPCYVLDIKIKDCTGEECEKCRKDFWLAELPEAD